MLKKCLSLHTFLKFLTNVATLVITLDTAALESNSGVARNLTWRVQLENFGLKALLMLKFCI